MTLICPARYQVFKLGLFTSFQRHSDEQWDGVKNHGRALQRSSASYLGAMSAPTVPTIKRGILKHHAALAGSPTWQ